MDIAIYIVVGAIIGFMIGMTGVGGGSILVPTLILVFRFEESVAVGTANLYTFLTKSFATYQHIALKHVNFPLSLIFLVGAMPAAILASYYVSHTAKLSGAEFQTHLRIFIVAALVLAVGMVIFNLFRVRPMRGTHQAVYTSGGNTVAEPEAMASMSAGRLAAGIALGSLVGLLVGATALGTAVVGIPILLLCFNMSARKAVGSCIFIGLVLTLAAALIYGEEGQLDWSTGFWLSIGSLIGVYFGSKLTAKIPERKLQMAVIAIIIAATLLLVFKESIKATL